MKKGFIKAGCLAGIFVAAVIILELVFNSEGEDLTTTMSDATLPVLYFVEEEKQINPLYGYDYEMDPVYTRDTITALSEDLILPVHIDTYGSSIDSIRYEIRTLDSSRLVEDTEVTRYEKNGQSIDTTFQIQNLLDENVEYQMIIQLGIGKKQINYYTRIIIPKQMHVKECITFAWDFHEKTFDKDNQRELSTYMEPDSVRANNDLHMVDIHSSLDQLFWADLDCSVVGPVQTSVKEVKKEYSVVILSYVLGSKGSNGEAEYYNVEEYYRIRYGQERMFLLDFQRTVNQIFREDGDNFTPSGINLGIRSEEVNYISNETGTILGFVQEGDLWEYNNLNKSLSRVFSFRGYEQIDLRENNSQHSIRIIRVDETGSMDFIVYGYMNRGIHEGVVGISVFHYDSIVNTIEELVWIPFNKSYQMIDEVLGKVMYVNDNNQFYIMTEGIIYQIDLNTRKKKVLAQGNGEKWFCVSPDNSRLAWIEGGNADAGEILHLYNMATGTEQIIRAKDNEYIRPLGFMETDLILGRAKRKQVSAGVSGVTIFPMHTVEILGEDGEIKKDYHKKNIYIIDVTTEGYTIRLERVKYSGGSYVPISQDTIMNMKGDSEETTTLQLVVSEKKQTQVTIQMSAGIADQNPNLLAAKLVAYKDNRTMEIENTGEENYYYAYAKGQVVLISPNEAEAVKAASEQTGVVVDGKAQYIWQQAKSMYKNTLPGMYVDTSKVGTGNVERALSVILGTEGVSISVGELLDSGRTAKEILQTLLPGATVLDLTGCSLDQMFYYVDQGYLVYAMADASKPVLLCGYTKDRVDYYNPADNDVKTISIDSAREMFKDAGNIFLTYVIKEEH
ncbi:MAG: hypothetical protein ACI39H_09460 [Lachnospiraceae bacterium]